MKIEVNISKKYFLFALGAFIILAGVLVVNAYGTNVPATFGHSPGEIASGTFAASPQDDAWTFPGKVVLSTDDGNNGALQFRDTTGYSYIEWLKQDLTRAFWMGYVRNTGVFRLGLSTDPNDYAGLTVAPNGDVGIGTYPDQPLHVVTPDRIVIESTPERTVASQAPAIYLQGPEFNNLVRNWRIAFRGPNYAGGGPLANDLLFIYYNGTGTTRTFRLTDAGEACFGDSGNDCRSSWDRQGEYCGWNDPFNAANDVRCEISGIDYLPSAGTPSQANGYAGCPTGHSYREINAKEPTSGNTGWAGVCVKQ